VGKKFNFKFLTQNVPRETEKNSKKQKLSEPKVDKMTQVLLNKKQNANRWTTTCDFLSVTLKVKGKVVPLLNLAPYYEDVYVEVEV